MLLLWLGFVVFVVAMLALDMGIVQRHAHAVSMREALGRSAAWISLGLGFTVVVYYAYELQWFGLGREIDGVDGLVNDGALAVGKYLTGYVIEQSLSVDNIVVMVLIFKYFGVAPQHQHRVLFWGILGAMLLRGVMIVLGAALIARFHWILYVFGVFLIGTGVRMCLIKAEHPDLDKNPLIRLARRLVPVTAQFHGGHFVVRAGSSGSREPIEPGAAPQTDAVVDAARKGALLVTPLGLALIVVEFSDLIFAVDSIPAIFAITADPFLVFTSNIFAILGLRSLYFALAGLLDRFRYLNTAIGVVIVIVGAKMLAATWLHQVLGRHANFCLLGVILLVLTIGIIASMRANTRDERSRSGGAGAAHPDRSHDGAP